LDQLYLPHTRRVVDDRQPRPCGKVAAYQSGKNAGLGCDFLGWGTTFRFKELRQERTLSIRELAAKAGMSYANLHKIETGQRKQPWPSTIRKLADALGVDPGELIVKEER
jgi:DNA-binding Xre family transcriptional regulator